ncbi:MAG: di-trans,poly-cis-decaprenylcistransferase [DPANN group archaeon]|nr:di-trans,poly-cis-decaprenylcistransferase [DPANN group archaeon]
MIELGNSIPRHIGIICDGNRRFAHALGEVVWMGHEYGAKKVEEVLDWCFELGVKEVTLWLFSAENLKRPKEELGELFRIGENMTREFIKNPKIHQHKVRLSVIGDTSIFPAGLQAGIRDALEATKDYSNLRFNIAAGYGGKAEIISAVQKVGELIKDGKINPADVTKELLEAHMYSADVADVDLVIRTSGEQRTSGFLMWKSDYAEYYFCEKFWPAFEKEDLIKAIMDYSERKRRFGK